MIVGLVSRTLLFEVMMSVVGACVYISVCRFTMLCVSLMRWLVVLTWTDVDVALLRSRFVA